MKRTGAKNIARGISALFVGIAVSASVVLPARADDSLTQHVDSSEQVVREEATIERGHVDLGPRLLIRNLRFWHVMTQEKHRSGVLWTLLYFA